MKNESFIKIHKLKTKLLIFIYPIVLLFFVRAKNRKLDNIKLVYSEHHKKILKEVEAEEYGIGLLSFKMPNIVSEFSFAERLLILKDIFIFVKYLPQKKLIFYVPEFLIILNFIKNNQNKRIILASHFDRIITWISEMKKKYNFSLEIYQHGVVSSLEIPIKINIDEINVFFESEFQLFRDYIIEKQKTQYNVIGFKSNIEFFKKNSSEFKIGIASQKGYTQLTISLVEKISYLLKNNVEIYIFPHPQENIEEYKNYFKDNRIIIVSRVKVSNLDILITYFSTIIYDYIVNLDFKGQIISYPVNYNYELSFFKNSRVKKTLLEKEMFEIIKENYLKNKEGGLH
ncbi:MAG: hypothetical protein ACRC7N_01135 [Clostridium sp.]